MARDENDRPYEDGQGRSLNPEMTGDVLSPRWSTEDTDEQPAIQVVGNETYILPLDKGGEPQLIEGRDVLGGHDVLDDGPHDVLSGSGASGGSHDVLVAQDFGGPSGGHDLLGPASGAHDVLGGAGGSHDALDERSGPHDMLDEPSGPHGVLGEPSSPHRDEDDSPYLPLDRGYDGGFDDDREEGRSKRGFLGSGWTDDSDDGRSRGRSGYGDGEGEVRRRTRKLLVAAAAVVMVGVGAGFLLTGNSSDDPCSAGQCASAGEVSSPSESALPEEETPYEEEDTPEPVDSDTSEPEQTEAANPVTPPTRQARTTREPSARPTNTRAGEPTTKTSVRPTRAPQNRMQGTDEDPTISQRGGTDRTREPETRSTQQQQQQQAPQTQAPETQAPAPTPTKEERKGLLDILFPWA